ncbi:hypothetical protein RB594_000195 [Gaeumannomyces avenae]
MEYKRQTPIITPRLIIHGGAGNITPGNLPPDRYNAFRTALLTIVSKTHTYITTPRDSRLPTALDAAVNAVLQLEDNPLFNAGHGAVFTRDGVNELEASVMVSRGRAKRGVGATGLRRMRNPILLARAMLEHGDADLGGPSSSSSSSSSSSLGASSPAPSRGSNDGHLDIPSAQGHTLLHGPAAEQLAAQYGLALVDPSYFFTQRRWDEHVAALGRERASGGAEPATWSATEYLPQGTVGAVALDSDGVLCVATSTGGLTNKLTGRIGDTPVPGAGFWAEEWEERGDPSSSSSSSPAREESWRRALARPDAPVVQLGSALRALMVDCLPTPFLYAPIAAPGGTATTTVRAFAGSGTGNGDSFMRTAALRTVAALARFGTEPSAAALTAVAGPGGELQRSAGDRWGARGEGEGGIIGIEVVMISDAEGRTVEVRSEISHDHNCGGMYRAWIDDAGNARYQVFKDVSGAAGYGAEGTPEDVRHWCGEKTVL